MAKVKKEEQYKKMTWMERRNLVKEKKDSLEFLRKIKE